MPRINLLPVRALARLEQAKQELWVAAALNLGLLVLLAGGYQVGERRTQDLVSQQTQAKAQLDQLSVEVQQTQDLKAKSTALTTKLEAIDKLRGLKAGPAPMLAFFSDVLAELPRVWLTRFTQLGNTITLEGGAMSQGDISAFQLALGERKPAFGEVELALVSSAHGESSSYLQWTITCQAPDEAKAAP